MELLKALYNTLRAARLFWERLSAKLLEEGFTPNPYDSCTVNKMINDKQCTIVWHIDIRFYFVADLVASGDLRIEHCPTEDMLLISLPSHCKVRTFPSSGIKL